MNDLYVMGELCPVLCNKTRRLVSKRRIKKIPIKALRFVALSFPLFLFCVCLVQARQQESNTSAATGLANPASITPLNIGDTIPESLWNLPLQMVKAGQEGSATVKLKDYKGKLIILDFWATWCGPCIASLPHLYDIQKQAGDDVRVLPTTTQMSEQIIRFMKESSSFSSIPNGFSTLVETEILHNYFPHKSIPHTIIINPAGRLAAITTPPYITPQNVTAMLSGKGETYVSTKRSLHLEKKLLKPSYDDVNIQKPLFYSTIMGFTDGFDAFSEILVDSIQGYKRFYAKNNTILQLYLSIAGNIGFNPTLPSRRIVLVSNPEAVYSFSKEDDTRSVFDMDWNRKNRYCYESIMPVSTSKKEIRTRMEKDLYDFLGYRIRVENRKVDCLVLKDLKKDGPYMAGPSSGNGILVLNGVLDDRTRKKMGRAESGATSYMRGYPIRNLIYLLNNQRGAPLPFVMNETGFEGNIDLDLPEDLGNLSAWRQCLQKQGLDLVPIVRNLDMLVITEKGFEPSGRMKLNRYGYIPE